jgi:uncharacterized membrane protein
VPSKGQARLPPFLTMSSRSSTRRYFITGLLIWVPLVITVWVLSVLVGTMDQTLLLLPPALRTESWLGIYVPGMGVLLTVLVIFLTGLAATNIIGQRLVRFWEGMLARIPVVNSIYNGVKQVSDTLFLPNGQAFRKALLVEWPRPGMWTIAFLTGTPGGDLSSQLSGEHVSIYVPTTPNPTSGYFVLVPKSSVVELELSVDEALKYIISMGVVAPGRRSRLPSQPAVPEPADGPAPLVNQ